MPDKESKPRQCIIKEQTIGSGKMEGNLVFKFEKIGGDHPDAITVITIIGDILPCGNFDLKFDSVGNHVGGGVALGSLADTLKKEWDEIQVRNKEHLAGYKKRKVSAENEDA